MLEKNKSIFSKMIIFSICIIFLLTIISIMIKYEVEGETNMPFKITKISLISNVDGKNNEYSEQYWNMLLTQNNDIYINIEKNEQKQSNELIDKIIIENIEIITLPRKGNIELYKASNNNSYENREEDKIINKIEYKGDTQSNLGALKIGNQGGIVGFRVSNENLGEYSSSNTEIKIDGKLLKEINISKEDLYTKVSFDIILKVSSGIEYKSKYEIELPCDDITEGGICKKEITDLTGLIFKRI